MKISGSFIKAHELLPYPDFQGPPTWIFNFSLKFWTSSDPCGIVFDLGLPARFRLCPNLACALCVPVSCTISALAQSVPLDIVCATWAIAGLKSNFLSHWTL